jgi:AcrR family transcriptional regulator
VSLREQQRAVTQRAILDAVVALVAEGELDEVSVPAVARRSGVSVATIYRHYPTKEALLTAAAWVPAAPAAGHRPARFGGPELRDYLTVLWRGFAGNLALLRHQVASRSGREMRAQRLVVGQQQLAAELAAEGIDPESPAGQRLISLCLLLGGSLALLELHDRQGLAVEQAADDVTWAAGVLFEATRREGREP